MSHVPAARPLGEMATKLIFYISRPAESLHIDDVHDLVFNARSHNVMNGIYGLLTYDRRGFLQILEGTVGAVDEVMARIMVDRRHHGITILQSIDNPEQHFLTFSDIVCAGDALAQIDALHPSALDRMTPELAAMIRAGHDALSEAETAATAEERVS